LYPSALTFPVLPEALQPLLEAVAVDAVAAVLASAVLLAVALAVHLRSPLAVAGKLNRSFSHRTHADRFCSYRGGYRGGRGRGYAPY